MATSRQVVESRNDRRIGLGEFPLVTSSSSSVNEDEAPDEVDLCLEEAGGDGDESWVLQLEGINCEGDASVQSITAKEWGLKFN